MSHKASSNPLSFVVPESHCVGHCVERRNYKTIRERQCIERSRNSTKWNLATEIVLNGGRKIQRATVGTKVKHWKGLVGVTKGPTKFQSHKLHCPHSLEARHAIREYSVKKKGEYDCDWTVQKKRQHNERWQRNSWQDVLHNQKRNVSVVKT